jgi:DNA-binding protein HU-beta
MAKMMSKSQMIAHMAEKLGVSKKVAAQGFEEFTKLAYREAKSKGAFVVPGIGKLVMSTRAARQMVMRFGPKAGQTIQVPAKRVVKFRVSKQAKEAILGK